MLTMSKIVCSAVACIVLGTVSVSAESNTNKGSTPNGKPFLHINGELSQLSETVASLQDQVDALVNSVSTLQEKQAVIEAKVVELEEDLEANAAFIAALQVELELIKQEIQTNNYITTQTCPEGQAVVGFDENSVTCSNMTATSEYYTVRTLTRFKEGQNAISVVASCYENDSSHVGRVTGGGFAVNSKGKVYKSAPAYNNAGWYVIGQRDDTYYNTLQAYAVCVKNGEYIDGTINYTY